MTQATEPIVSHTPGPWNVDDRTIYGGPDEQSIAELTNRHHSSMKPNGRLIAAAPELLAALKGALAFIRDVAAEDLREADDTAWVFQQAELLIAKAEGRTS